MEGVNLEELNSSGADIFLFVFFIVVLYGALVWSYMFPEDSMLLGKRWMYKEQPEITEDAINFYKNKIIFIIIVVTFILAMFVYGSFQ